MQGRVRAERLELGALTAGDVNAFVVADCRWRTRQSAKLTVTALRSLLRFLHVDGTISEGLAERVPSDAPASSTVRSGLPSASADRANVVRQQVRLWVLQAQG